MSMADLIGRRVRAIATLPAAAASARVANIASLGQTPVRDTNQPVEVQNASSIP
jgi:hypothetical protein